MRLVLLSFIIYHALELTSTEDAVCEDHNVYCDFYWSRGWFTCNNGAALWRYCPSSCGLCGDKDCVDKRKEHCGVLKQKGYCTALKPYMDKYCSRTCGACVYKEKPKLIPGCRNYEPRCPKWAKYGECEKSSETRKFCPKSCGVCGKVARIQRTQPMCMDQKPSLCKRKHICLLKHQEATKSCMKTCQMCGQNGRCFDTRSYCHYYKLQGFCKSTSVYYKFMVKYCTYSCEMC